MSYKERQVCPNCARWRIGARQVCVAAHFQQDELGESGKANLFLGGFLPDCYWHVRHITCQSRLCSPKFLDSSANLAVVSGRLEHSLAEKL